MEQTGKIKCQDCGKVLKDSEIPYGADYGTCQKCVEDYIDKIANKSSDRVRHCQDAI